LISLRLLKTKERYTSFSLLGHAPTSLGKMGENLLCAGVSALSQSCFLYLQKKELLREVTWQKGKLEFEISSPCLESEVALDILLTGMQDLKKQYPEWIDIYIGEENGT